MDELTALAGRRGEPANARLRHLAVADFYLTNPIARASAVMAECSALAAGRAGGERSGMTVMSVFFHDYCHSRR